MWASSVQLMTANHLDDRLLEGGEFTPTMTNGSRAPVGRAESVDSRVVETVDGIERSNHGDCADTSLRRDDATHQDGAFNLGGHCCVWVHCMHFTQDLR